jgi:CRISPR-associated protein Cas5t
MSGDALLLRIRAPFAAFRAFQAGVYRPTMPVMPPSAVYGLLLNLAGIEMRGPLDEPITRIKEGLPALTLAIGIIKQPGKGTVLQQLHSYRVGDDKQSQALQARTHGAMYWIAPPRR